MVLVSHKDPLIREVSIRKSEDKNGSKVVADSWILFSLHGAYKSGVQSAAYSKQFQPALAVIDSVPQNFKEADTLIRLQTSSRIPPLIFLLKPGVKAKTLFEALS